MPYVATSQWPALTAAQANTQVEFDRAFRTIVQDEDGNHQIWEQTELYEKLHAQSVKNPDQVDLETAIKIMESTKEINLPF